MLFVSCTSADGFAAFGRERLVGPPLLWPETRSALHQAAWRGELSDGDARDALRRLRDGPVRPRDHPRLGEEAWRIADEMGWAKTYDAEYLALARLLRCRLVTLDAGLRRRVAALGFVVGPTEL